jgi:hypothetical protein
MRMPTWYNLTGGRNINAYAKAVFFGEPESPKASGFAPYDVYYRFQ